MKYIIDTHTFASVEHMRYMAPDVVFLRCIAVDLYNRSDKYWILIGQ